MSLPTEVGVSTNTPTCKVTKSGSVSSLSVCSMSTETVLAVTSKYLLMQIKADYVAGDTIIAIITGFRNPRTFKASSYFTITT